MPTYQSPLRHHRRVPSYHREVKVGSLFFSLARTMYNSSVGDTQCALRIHKQSRRWQVTAFYQPIHYQGRDWTRFVWRCPWGCWSIWSRICKCRGKMDLLYSILGCEMQVYLSFPRQWKNSQNRDYANELNRTFFAAPHPSDVQAT